MNQLTEIMISRLEKKGVELDIIPGFIRDLVNTISIDHQTNLQELNKKLHLLGWDDFELDEYTLELIIASFETGSLSKRGTI